MASKRRIRRKMCGSKTRYDTAKSALRVALAVKRNTGDKGYVQSYRCRFCKGFHWGHR